MAVGHEEIFDSFGNSGESGKAVLEGRALSLRG